jgi:hypothetical protein
MLAPCKDCQERHIGCHAECERYIKFKEESAEIEKRRRADVEAWIDFKEYKKSKHKRLGGKNE